MFSAEAALSTHPGQTAVRGTGFQWGRGGEGWERVAGGLETMGVHLKDHSCWGHKTYSEH